MIGERIADVICRVADDLEIDRDDYWLYNQSEAALIELAEECGIVEHGVLADHVEVMTRND